MSQASSAVPRAPIIPSVRFVLENNDALASLGLLAELAGTWKGKGFNLIARPDKQQNANLLLELNQMRKTLEFDPISSVVPIEGCPQLRNGCAALAASARTREYYQASIGPHGGIQHRIDEAGDVQADQTAPTEWRTRAETSVVQRHLS